MFSVTLLIASFAIGCSGDSTTSKSAAKSTAKTEAKKTEPKKKAKFGTFNAKDLEKAADEINVVPSPIKMQKMLSEAGINGKLSEYVKANRGMKMESKNKDEIAIRVGVLLADLVLTVQTSTPADMENRLKALKKGFSAIGAGGDVQSTIDDMLATVKGKELNRDELLTEMDELAQVMVPELEYEAGEWVVPIIQAGSWLEGSYLVTSVVKKEGKYEQASKLLKQPGAIKYFLRYVQREGSTRAPKSIAASLEKTLIDLHTLSKKDKMSKEDIEKVHSVTGTLLSLM